MLGILAGICILFLLIALAVSVVESKGGYIGDSSMVPGILMLMVAALILATLMGWFTGHCGIWLN